MEKRLCVTRFAFIHWLRRQVDIIVTLTLGGTSTHTIDVTQGGVPGPPFPLSCCYVATLQKDVISEG